MKRGIALISSAAVLVLTLGLAASLSRAQGNMATHAKIGQPAPQFSLQDQNGKTVNLSDYAGKVVVLEWFNDACPYVQRHYKEGDISSTAQKYADKGVTWLAINSTRDTGVEHNKEVAGKWKIDRPILDDSNSQVAQLYGAKTTPHMFVIDKTGKLVYMGAIDNDPSGNKTEGKVNYVDKALSEVLAGDSVSVAETKPYGCGVHYQK